MTCVIDNYQVKKTGKFIQKIYVEIRQTIHGEESKENKSRLYGSET